LEANGASSASPWFDGQRRRRSATWPTPEELELPDIYEATKGERSFTGHLHADEEGVFPCMLNKWDTSAVEAKLAEDQVVGWLGTCRGRAGPSSSYTYNGEDHRCTPTSCSSEDKGRVGVDILEPHSLHQEHSAAKAKGLADFALSHGDEFGRIELIVEGVARPRQPGLTRRPSPGRGLGARRSAALRFRRPRRLPSPSRRPPAMQQPCASATRWPAMPRCSSILAILCSRCLPASQPSNELVGLFSDPAAQEILTGIRNVWLGVPVLQHRQRYQTLLGATGTGKTATMTWIIERIGGRGLVIAQNKTLAARLCNEFREFFRRRCAGC
jgi:hypothetical protein